VVHGGRFLPNQALTRPLPAAPAPAGGP
jgi:hypothetical protein